MSTLKTSLHRQTLSLGAEPGLVTWDYLKTKSTPLVRETLLYRVITAVKYAHPPN